MWNAQTNAAKHPELFDDEREKEREELDKQWDDFFKEKKEAREKAIIEQREKFEKEFLEKEQKQFEIEKDRYGMYALVCGYRSEFVWHQTRPVPVIFLLFPTTDVLACVSAWCTSNRSRYRVQ